MLSRFLLRAAAVFAAAVLASPAFAQIKPDTPVSPPSAAGSGLSRAAPAAINALLASSLDATSQAVAALSSSSLEPVASRHATVLEVLATAHASPAVVDCVTKFQAAENAALADNIRKEIAKLLANLKKQRTATLAAVMKMAQAQGADPGASQDLLADVGAAFDQMQRNVEVEQAKLIAGLR
jgi:hypothetical protein